MVAGAELLVVNKVEPKSSPPQHPVLELNLNREQVWFGNNPVVLTDWFIGVLRFLAGQKKFKVAGLEVVVPDDNLDGVVIEERVLPYSDFCKIVVDSLQDCRNIHSEYKKEYQVVLREIDLFGKNQPAVKITTRLPAENRERIEIADRLEVMHNDPGGLGGLKQKDFHYKY